MRISAKGRYALAAVIEIARQTRESEMIPVINISSTLGISKLYLEQVASQLKNGGVIFALKGSKGGYQLARKPENITALEILMAVETTIIEQADATVTEQAPAIETALQEKVFRTLDHAIKECLKNITVRELLDYSEIQQTEQAFMLNM